MPAFSASAGSLRGRLIPWLTIWTVSSSSSSMMNWVFLGMVLVGCVRCRLNRAAGASERQGGRLKRPLSKSCGRAGCRGGTRAQNSHRAPVHLFLPHQSTMPQLQREIEHGSATFCSTCGKLFRKFNDDDDDDDGNSRCMDCAAKSRLVDAVEWAVGTNEIKEQRGTLSRLVALAQEPSSPHSPIRRNMEPSSSVKGTGAQSAVHEEHEAGVAALHDLILLTRRENVELRRRLHAVRGEAPAEPPAGAPSASRDDEESGGGPAAHLALLLNAIIPIQLRHTSRYRPLDDALDELRAQWTDRERRLRAQQAALLGAEATVVTLQEELLLVESSEVTLGSLVKQQQAEIAQLRAVQQETSDLCLVKQKEADHADVRRVEAETLLRLRHDAEVGLRQSHREMQKLLADAHTSLGQFVSVQQVKRGNELENRRLQLEEWADQHRAFVQQQQQGLAHRGQGAGHAEKLAMVLSQGLSDHKDALADLDARRREADDLERDWFEKRIESLEVRVHELEAARSDIDGSIDGVRQAAIARQIDLLRKQRDEASHARELATDELRSRVVHEQHTLSAMRSGYAEASDQLQHALGQLPELPSLQESVRSAMWCGVSSRSHARDWPRLATARGSVDTYRPSGMAGGSCWRVRTSQEASPR